MDSPQGHLQIGSVAFLRHIRQLAPPLGLKTPGALLPWRQPVQHLVLMNKNRCRHSRHPVNRHVSSQPQAQKPPHGLSYHRNLLTAAIQKSIAVTHRIIPVLTAHPLQILGCCAMTCQPYPQHRIAQVMEMTAQKQHFCRNAGKTVHQQHPMAASPIKKWFPSAQNHSLTSCIHILLALFYHKK